MTARPINNLDAAAGAYVRGQAALLGIGAAGVAERTGIPYPSVRRYFNGERSMSVGDFLAMLSALEVTDGRALAEIRRLSTKVS